MAKITKKLFSGLRNLSLKVWLALLLPTSMMLTIGLFMQLESFQSTYIDHHYPTLTVTENEVGSPEDLLFVAWDGNPVDGMYQVHKRQVGVNTWGYRFINRMFPIIGIMLCGLTMLGMALLFYHFKLRRPMRQLSDGMERVRKQDLDFSISYRSGDEFGRLCAAFEEMRQQLDATFKELWDSQESQRRMIQAFAHDLRTPLTVLKGYTDLMSLQTERHTLQPDTVKQNILFMNDNILRMESYLNALREMRSYEEWAFTPEITAIPDWSRKLEVQWMMLASSTDISLDVKCNTVHSAELDGALLNRILDNLVGNAFCFASSCIHIVMDTDDNGLHITVEDDGPGFSKESLQRAYEAFYRGDAARSSSGMGLGLTIARTLAQRHGGELQLRNLMIEDDTAGASVLLYVPCKLIPPAPLLNVSVV